MPNSSRLIGLLLLVAALLGTPVSASAAGARPTAAAYRPMAEGGASLGALDRHWIRGDASASRATFFACFGDSGDRCASDQLEAMPPGRLAVVLAVCLLAGAVGAWYLGGTLIDVIADAIRDATPASAFVPP